MQFSVIKFLSAHFKKSIGDKFTMRTGPKSRNCLRIIIINAQKRNVNIELITLSTATEYWEKLIVQVCSESESLVVTVSS